MCISVELLDAVSQAAQKYEALYMGILPVNKAMGEDWGLDGLGCVRRGKMGEVRSILY